MRFVSLFSGIGGMDLGLERAGWECVAQVENDPWCTQILEKHWPDTQRWSDIHDVSPADLPDCDAIVGGFPCQPVSLAGKHLAQDDDRWLWPEFFRIVRGVRPRYVIVENVPGLATRGMGDVLGDLASIGYDAEWQSIPAAAVGAPHLRWRIFIVAYPQRDELRQQPGRRHGQGGSGASLPRVDGPKEPVADPDGGRLPVFGEQERAWIESTRRNLIDGRGPRGWGSRENVADPEGEPVGTGLRQSEPGGQRRRRPGDSDSAGDWWAVEPDVGRVANGVPRRVDRLRGLGNAVVPQVAEWIARRVDMCHKP